MVTQKEVRTCNIFYLIWLRYLIKSRAVINRIFFSSLNKPIFLHACATCSKLQSEIWTMMYYVIFVYKNPGSWCNYAISNSERTESGLVGLTTAWTHIVSGTRCQSHFFLLFGSGSISNRVRISCNHILYDFIYFSFSTSLLDPRRGKMIPKKERKKQKPEDFWGVHIR